MSITGEKENLELLQLLINKNIKIIDVEKCWHVDVETGITFTT